MLNIDNLERREGRPWLPEPVLPRGPVLYRATRRSQLSGEKQSIAIRLADTDGERNSASMVINRQYGARGYGSDHRLPVDQRTVTFTASVHDHVFGTITLASDSAAGLAVSRTFPDEVARLRQQPGAVICELTKFAFDPAPDSRPFLASLFHIVYLYGTQRFGGTDLLIEVNPRHVRFYEIMLGFERVGALRENLAVGAPAQLMHIRVAEIGRRIEALAGRSDIRDRSLYRYFFSAREEVGLRRRIARYAGDESELPS